MNKENAPFFSIITEWWKAQTDGPAKEVANRLVPSNYPVLKNELIEKCTKDDCSDYRGRQDKTKSGYTCQRWNIPNPVDPGSTNHKSGVGPEDENFCRNPDSSDTMWCYTTSLDKTWEACKPLDLSN